MYANVHLFLITQLVVPMRDTYKLLKYLVGYLHFLWEVEWHLRRFPKTCLQQRSIFVGSLRYVQTQVMQTSYILQQLLVTRIQYIPANYYHITNITWPASVSTRSHVLHLIQVYCYVDPCWLPLKRSKSFLRCPTIDFVRKTKERVRLPNRSFQQNSKFVSAFSDFNSIIWPQTRYTLRLQSDSSSTARISFTAFVGKPCSVRSVEQDT